jgi:kinesin family protein 11
LQHAFKAVEAELDTWKAEAHQLRGELLSTSAAAKEAHRVSSEQVQTILAQERQQAAESRNSLIAQITSMINAAGEEQDARLFTKLSAVKKDMDESNETVAAALGGYAEKIDTWATKYQDLALSAAEARETLKSKLKNVWAVRRFFYHPIKCLRWLYR